MIFTLSLAAVALTFAAIPTTRGAEITVTVGGPGGVVAYNPPSVNASVGDVVTFVFQQKNHTVTQSSFASPCTALDGGFDSGFIPISDDNTDGPFQTAQLTVQDTNPIWVYCRQAGHCQQGMVFAINPDGKFDAFKAAAMGQSSTNSTSNSTAASSAAPPASSTAAAAAGNQGVSFTTIPNPAASASPTPPASSSSTTAATSTNMTNDHKIVVGGANTFTFSPANISAQPGDTITFEFHQKNHTATQSSFGAPCQPLAQTSQSGQSGFDSGFMPVSDNATTFPTFTIQVNDTAPIWVYCRQQGHCGEGMVFSANAIETGTNNFEAFQERAKTLNGTSTTSGAGHIVARASMHIALATAIGGIILGMLL